MPTPNDVPKINNTDAWEKDWKGQVKEGSDQGQTKARGMNILEFSLIWGLFSSLTFVNQHLFCFVLLASIIPCATDSVGSFFSSVLPSVPLRP